jgi:hypothetical protein
MQLSKNVSVVLVSALFLVACFDGEDAQVPGIVSDAGFPATEIDAHPAAPDAMPLPDAPPGTPDAAPLPDAGPPPVSFSADIVPVLMASCGGCHLKDVAGAGGLTLGVTAQLAYPAMVNQATHAASCATMLVVDANSRDPMQSSLYLKLIGATCGTQMPKGRPALSAETLELFARWIAEGSADN